METAGGGTEEGILAFQIQRMDLDHGIHGHGHRRGFAQLFEQSNCQVHNVRTIQVSFSAMVSLRLKRKTIVRLWGNSYLLDLEANLRGAD